jgi:hypothetical protein
MAVTAGRRRAAGAALMGLWSRAAMVSPHHLVVGACGTHTVRS